MDAWLAEMEARVLEALRNAGNNEPAGFWRDKAVTAGFWRRRLAHETTVHRSDADLALGLPPAALPPELATDGVDEVLEVFLPYAPTKVLSWPPAGVLHLVEAAKRAGWSLQASPASAIVRRGADVPLSQPAGGVATVTASAEELLLVCWGRQRPAPSQVSGDPDVLERWLACFCW